MQSGYPKHRCYADFTHRSFAEFIKLHNASALRLALLVSDFARQMAAVYEQFAKDIQTIISAFKAKYSDLNHDRPTDTPSTILSAWECLLYGTENDAQAHMDVAVLLRKNVYRPLEEVAVHKQTQTHKLNGYRDQLEETMDKVEHDLQVAEENYQRSVKASPTGSNFVARQQFHTAHNEYLCHLCASNRTIEEFHYLVPQVLEELEEIYIDTSNTVNIAMESHALMLLTKADEQHHRYKEMLKVCRQVTPQSDITYFLSAIEMEPTKIELSTHTFRPSDVSIYNAETLTVNQLIVNQHTEPIILERRQKLQKEAAILTSYIKHNQDSIHTLMMICQRNLANHLYSKVYETQGDMCCKRNEIRLANLQLASIRAQIEALSPKQNGSVESLDQDSKKSSATIKSMWKKAFKSLKSTSDTKLTKKGSLIKKKQNSQEVEVEENAEPGEIDPVYSLLKCAADLPKASKPSCGIHAQCSGHHSSASTKGESSSTSTSKTTSPASSGPLNSRLAPENVGSTSPDEKYVFSAANLRKKFASSSNRASSLELEDKLSYTQSPKDSPKSQKKQNTQLYVVLYNFKGKEKDDLDLRAGWRVNVLDSSDQDWWKGKCNGKVGYFPATYLIPIQTGQRVFQVIHSMHLTEGGNGMKLHKDQIVLQIGEENMGMVRVQAANKKHALCPLKYLKEV
ncbi:nostrin-like isoform X3 [Crassostrea angulata]|uniref:nostrin-like isoform X3 n=1 Tax=Magallana angulata TaxID=2784310 RepID=UPI0022B19B49|nr:nostrin-like isoform X3 [Crassostrea angulata]